MMINLQAFFFFFLPTRSFSFFFSFFFPFFSFFFFFFLYNLGCTIQYKTDINYIRSDKIIKDRQTRNKIPNDTNHANLL